MKNEKKKWIFSKSFFNSFQYVSLSYSLKRSQSHQNHYMKHILNAENMVHTQDQMFII